MALEAYLRLGQENANQFIKVRYSRYGRVRLADHDIALGRTILGITGDVIERQESVVIELPAETESTLKAGFVHGVIFDQVTHEFSPQLARRVAALNEDV